MTEPTIERVTVPARAGRAVRVPAGARLRVATPEGRQAADFFAFTPDLSEWLSPMHTWATTRSIRPRRGHVFLSQRRRPMLLFVEDGAGGVHDMLIAACDEERYRQFGVEGHHRSCAENLRLALAELGLEAPTVPQPVNLFTATEVAPDGSLGAPPNPVPPGAFVVLEALRDLVCAVSSCPFDLAIPGWGINDPGGPTEIELAVQR